MIKIMFVCHGNICRSPMAEFVLKDLVKKEGLEDEFIISSSATSTEEIWNGVGNTVYPPAFAELKKHGIDAGGKRAVQLKAQDLNKYDYFIGKTVTRTKISSSSSSGSSGRSGGSAGGSRGGR